MNIISHSAQIFEYANQWRYCLWILLKHIFMSNLKKIKFIICILGNNKKQKMVKKHLRNNVLPIIFSHLTINTIVAMQVHQLVTLHNDSHLYKMDSICLIFFSKQQQLLQFTVLFFFCDVLVGCWLPSGFSFRSHYSTVVLLLPQAPAAVPVKLGLALHKRLFNLKSTPGTKCTFCIQPQHTQWSSASHSLFITA